MGVAVVGILSRGMVEVVVGIRNRDMVVGDTNRSRGMVEVTLLSRGIRLRGTVVGMVRLKGMVVVDTVPPQRSMEEWVRREVRHWGWVEDCWAVRFWRTPLRAGMMEAAMEVAMVGVMVVMTGVVMVEGMEEETRHSLTASASMTGWVISDQGCSR